MKKIDLKVGFTCNNKCRFCVQGNKRDKHGDFDTTTLLARLEEGRRESDQIVFTGGEATIRKDFIDLVARARSLGYAAIQIQTNGRMFSDHSFCERTIEAGANNFSLALHGHTPELHDYLTRAEGSFRQTVKGIRNLKGLDQYVGTNTVVTRSNYRNLPEIAGLLVHLGVDQFQLAFVHALGTAGENFDSVVPRYTLAEPYVKAALAAGLRAKKIVMTEAIPYCFMDGFHDYIAEKIIPRTKIYDLQTLDDYTEYRRTIGKQKGPACSGCRHDEACEGPWREYPEHYGFAEFRPCP